MIRVVLGKGDLEDFVSTSFTDQYISAYFVPLDAPYEVPFDIEEARSAGPDFAPKPRRFTISDWDPVACLMTLDFVTHGDQGYAGTWAQRAQPGDRLQFQGPNGSYAPNPESDWHLLAGDESALPAISASVASLPIGKPCVVLIVVDSAEDEIEIASKGNLRLIWLHRSRVQNPEEILVQTIRDLDFPTGRYDVFVHGEAAEVRAVRKHLILDRGVEKSGSSISPYWRRACWSFTLFLFSVS